MSRLGVSETVMRWRVPPVREHEAALLPEEIHPTLDEFDGAAAFHMIRQPHLDLFLLVVFGLT